MKKRSSSATSGSDVSGCCSDGSSNKEKINNNRLILDLRNGINCALTRLNLLATEEIDHVILRQSAYLMTNLGEVNQHDLANIFRALAQLGHLKTIVISDFEQVALPASCLTMLMRHSLQLSALRLDAVLISGSREEVRDLADVLQCHPALEDICFSGCASANEERDDVEESENDSSQPFLWPIAKAIAKIPTLTMVEIVETSFPPSGAWTGECLSELSKSESLKILRVRGIRFLGDGDIALIARSLHFNNALKELWILACELGLDGGSGPEAIAEMLRINTSLEILGLNRLSFNEHAIVIADALKNNRSLRGLHLCLRDGFTARIYKSYATLLLEHNYVLEKINGGFMGSHAAGDEAQIDFYLRMNRNGRRSLLQNDNATREQWLDALCLQSDDVSALFYLLSRNPSLCGAS